MNPRRSARVRRPVVETGKLPGLKPNIQLFTSEADGANSSLKLVNGMKLKTSQALDAAEQFLGKGYKDMGNRRFISVDGCKQVRMGDADILGYHSGGEHMNFEKLIPNLKKPGKMIPDTNNNIHIFWRINFMKKLIFEFLKTQGYLNEIENIQVYNRLPA